VSESEGTDSVLGGPSMPKPYSEDLRERVIEAIESGASRREAAENFRLSPSSAVKWWRRWRDTGSVKAKLSGGSKSPLEAHGEWPASSALLKSGRGKSHEAHSHQAWPV
jgi:transposase-like protein